MSVMLIGDLKKNMMFFFFLFVANTGLKKTPLLLFQVSIVIFSLTLGNKTPPHGRVWCFL